MSTKKPAVEDEPTPVLVHRPDDLQGTLKQLGGSQSDLWNTNIANQAINSLWIKNSNAEGLSKQRSAALEGLCGIGPRDEIEGAGRQENLNQANSTLKDASRILTLTPLAKIMSPGF